MLTHSTKYYGLIPTGLSVNMSEYVKAFTLQVISFDWFSPVWQSVKGFKLCKTNVWCGYKDQSSWLLCFGLFSTCFRWQVLIMHNYLKLNRNENDWLIFAYHWYDGHNYSGNTIVEMLIYVFFDVKVKRKLGSFANLWSVTLNLHLPGGWN